LSLIFTTERLRKGPFFWIGRGGEKERGRMGVIPPLKGVRGMS